MRKQLLFVVPVLLLLASCQKEKSPTPTTPQPAPQLKVDSTTLKLSGNKDARDSFSLQYSGNWAITITPSTATWLKVGKVSGTGNQKIYVTVEQDNKSGSERSATISITPNDESAKAVRVAVTQREYTPAFKVLWNKLYGGSEDDFLPSLIKTTDGGYLMAGTTLSSDGDVSVNKGNKDVWVVKVDAEGNKVWEKSYGGSNFENGAFIVESSDGSYFVAAQSHSNDGDVTANKGLADLWVLKISATGNLIWQKSLGGSASEYFSNHNITSSADGGCVLAAGTFSNNGDVSGNHGDIDVWVLKLDGNGNITWKRTLGGTEWDEALAVTRGADGGYVVAGFTHSNNGDVHGKHGTGAITSDAWVIKMDDNGTVVWSNVYGGSGWESASDIIATPDKGYIIAGTATSTDGDVSGTHVGTGNDIWIIKIDGSGSKVWQKVIGGSSEDYASCISAVPDGYILSGTTHSNDGDVAGHHGGGDAWVVKIDGNGALKWQRAFGGTAFDGGGTILPTNDGNYIFSGSTASNDGDVKGNHGKIDGWVVKFSY